MSNTIKYSEGSEDLALNKGNWWIGTGDSNKGPTVESGYWNAINPPDGGYTVYLNKESNGPSIHSITSDENLISFTNKISGQNYTTVAECLVYYQTQDDKLCVNREIENIITDGLILNLDASYVSSYPESGNIWYDLSGNGNNGTLINGPTFDSGNGGSFMFDGTNDYVLLTNPITLSTNTAISMWISSNETNTGARYLRLLDGNPSSPVANWFEFEWYNRILSRNSLGTNFFFGFPLSPAPSLEQKLTNVVFSFNLDASVSIFINGVESNYTGTGDSIIDSELTFQSIMKARNSYNPGGSLANFQAYNRELSATEVLQNYNALKGRFGL